jgi:hypothetical protein
MLNELPIASELRNITKSQGGEEYRSMQKRIKGRLNGMEWNGHILPSETRYCRKT